MGKSNFLLCDKVNKVEEIELCVWVVSTAESMKNGPTAEVIFFLSFFFLKENTLWHLYFYYEK